MSGAYELWLGRNSEILPQLCEFVMQQGWSSAYVSGAVGSVRDVLFATPVSMELPPKVELKHYDGPAELVSFTGEILRWQDVSDDRKATQGDSALPLFVHVHASIALPGHAVVGGGLRRGRVFAGLKVYIFRQDT